MTSLKILFRTMISQKMNQECQKKFPYIRIILMQSYEMQKPETGQKKPDPYQPENFMSHWTSMSKEFYLHKNFFDITIKSTKTGNRKPVRKTDPGPTKFFYGLTGMSIQICMHWNFFDSSNRYKDVDQLSHDRIITTIPLYRSRKIKFAISKRVLKSTLQSVQYVLIALFYFINSE